MAQPIKQGDIVTERTRHPARRDCWLVISVDEGNGDPKKTGNLLMCPSDEDGKKAQASGKITRPPEFYVSTGKTNVADAQAIQRQ